MYWITGIPCPQCSDQGLGSFCGYLENHNAENHERIIEMFGHRRSNDLKPENSRGAFGLIKVCLRKKLVRRSPNHYQMIHYYGCIRGHRFSPGMLKIHIQRMRDIPHIDLPGIRFYKTPPELQSNINTRRLAWLYVTRQGNEIRCQILDLLLIDQSDVFHQPWREFMAYVLYFNEVIAEGKSRSIF